MCFAANILFWSNIKVINVSFVDQPETQSGGPCEGSFPSTCNFDNNCRTQARWTYNDDNDDITFTVETIVDLSNNWNGIGFSTDRAMVNIIVFYISLIFGCFS